MNVYRVFFKDGFSSIVLAACMYDVVNKVGIIRASSDIERIEFVGV